jgi:hypothetical protein
MRAKRRSEGMWLVNVAMWAIGMAVLSAAAHAQPRSPTMILGVPVPDRVAGLPHQQPTDSETKSPGQGYGIQFLKPGWKVDVYIYDLGMKSISDDPKSESVQKGFAEAKREIAELERRGVYTGVAAKGEFTIDDSAGRPRFLCAAYSYVHTRRDVTLDSFLCLGGVNKQFLGIRMDRPTSGNSEAELRRFVKGWTDVLWPSH